MSSSDEGEPVQQEPEEDSNSVDSMDTKSLKELIALFAELITTDPENNLAKLKDLVSKCEQTRKTKYRQLLVLSLAHIFKNIAPMYRIQELSAAQQAERVSKEVKQLRDYEQGLVHQGWPV
ncbi:hypothetical protein FF38_08344 [Lucilia cuprina]|uniref:Nucleolar complex-associated protein 3 N-terminal domain-containing protein n=1 Tax=Lucilia cuprina TaxID=7375 RepID=A0A0L0CQF5_LUCCU|nr:hypothetical protein FF38_08344 [Lucilia cuprina]